MAVPRGSGVQWPTLAVASLRRDYLDRRFTTWLGSNMARDNNWWSLVTSGGQLSHQLTRAQGSPSSITSLPSNLHPNTKTHLITDGQLDSSGICQQTRRDKTIAMVLHAGCCTAKHIPGTSNTIADLASCQFTSYSEWTLDQDVIYQTAQRIYRQDVDLFATRANHRLPWYVSRYPDPGAMATDAFLCDWSQWRSWIYAPLVLPRIIQKIKRDKATALILAPVCKGQPWFPSLLELLMDYPRQLPQIPHLITHPSQPEKEHLVQHSLR